MKNKKFCWWPTKCVDGTAWLESVYVSLNGNFYIRRHLLAHADEQYGKLQALKYELEIQAIPEEERKQALNNLHDLYFAREEAAKQNKDKYGDQS